YHNGGGASIGGLEDGGVYYVIKLSDTTVQLAQSAASAAFNPASTVSGNEIELAGHQFNNGQAVVYTSNGGEVIGGLASGHTYYVHVGSGAHISLASTQADAIAGTNLISLDAGVSTGTEHRFTGTGNVVTLDASSATGTRHSLTEAGTLSARAVWSEAQLENRISESILRPKAVSGTTATAEDPNIVGDNITIVSDGGAIGNNAASTVIFNLDELDELTPEQQIILAGAERHEVTFYAGRDGSGAVITNPSDPSATVQSVAVRRSLDVDVETRGTGVVNAYASTTAFLGSEETVRVDQIEAGGQTIVKVQKGIEDGRTDTTDTVNVVSGSLIIEAEEDSIGSADRPLEINLKPGATLTARSGDDVYIDVKTRGAVTGNVNVLSVFAQNDIVFRADGSIFDASDDDAAAPGVVKWNFSANTLTLTAGGSIGTSARFVEIDLSQTIDAQATGDIYLHEVGEENLDGGLMRVGLVRSTGGNVFLKADASILDADGLGTVDVQGDSIRLQAGMLGEIGAAGDDLDIDTGAGTLTSYSGLNTYVVELTGDLRLNTVTADPVPGDAIPGSSSAFIAALSGSILNGNPGGSNVLGGNAFLFARDHIGESANRIKSVVGTLEGVATTGSVWIDNQGALSLGGSFTANLVGMVAAGAITVTASSPVTQKKSIYSGDDILIIADDDGNDAGGLDAEPDHL